MEIARKLKDDEENEESFLSILLEDYGTTLLDLARFDECCTIMQELLELNRRLHGKKSEEYLQSLSLLGEAEKERCNHSRTIELLTEAEGLAK